MDRNRRRILHAYCAAALSPMAAMSGPELKFEWQCGDESIGFEELSFDPDAVERKRLKRGRAALQPRVGGFGVRLIEQAKGWLGKNRTNARDDIAKLLALFDLPFEYQGKPVPFCAAGVSFLASTVYAEASGGGFELVSFLPDVDHHHFVPSPSVWDMFYVAKGKRRWLDAKPKTLIPHPGWLVVYDFGKGADHVGIVETADGSSLTTIEFNTVPENAQGSDANGGAVARRHRKYTLPTVKGFIQTDLKTTV